MDALVPIVATAIRADDGTRIAPALCIIASAPVGLRWGAVVLSADASQEWWAMSERRGRLTPAQVLVEDPLRAGDPDAFDVRCCRQHEADGTTVLLVTEGGSED
jgi:hypothetical protein